MRKSKSIMMLFSIILTLIFANLIFSINTNAQLKFKAKQGIQFTLNPTLKLDISSDLVIPDLMASDNADSNEITVAVDTNVANGYYLAATTGTSSTNTDLINNSNSNYKFASLATNASISDMANVSGNTWGYKFKVGDGSYSNYSGLPLDGGDTGATGTSLVDTTDIADSKTVTFQIAAKAAADQPAGLYTNTINFYAVSHPLPEDKTIDDL